MYARPRPRALSLGLILCVVAGLALTAGFSHSVSSTPNTSASLRTAGAALPAAGMTLSNFMISPNPVSQGSSFSVSVVVNGGVSPYTFNWNPIPPNCVAGNVSQWQCTADNSGSYPIGVSVTDSTGSHASDSGSLSVSGSNGNGNGNGNGSNNGNNNSLNLSGLGNIFLYALIGELISFVLLILLTVGVLMIAVTLSRRLPKQPSGKLVCPACQARAPAGSKFCPACAAPLAPPK